jgi:hypothetical protein
MPGPKFPKSATNRPQRRVPHFTATPSESGPSHRPQRTTMSQEKAVPRSSQSHRDERVPESVSSSQAVPATPKRCRPERSEGSAFALVVASRTYPLPQMESGPSHRPQRTTMSHEKAVPRSSQSHRDERVPESVSSSRAVPATPKRCHPEQSEGSAFALAVVFSYPATNKGCPILSVPFALRVGYREPHPSLPLLLFLLLFFLLSFPKGNLLFLN